MKNKKYYLIALLAMTLLGACKKNRKADQEPTIVTEAHLGDSIKVSFPSGSLNSTQVSLKTVADKNTQTVFDETKDFFSVGKALPYQIVLNIGPAHPINDSIKMTIRIPDGFKLAKPSNYGFQVFAQIYQKGEEDSFDNFSIVASNYDAAKGEIEVYLTREVFTNTRTADKSYEAILMIATSPGENISINSYKGQLKTNAALDGCKIAQIACPLGTIEDCTTFKGSPFGLRLDPITGDVLQNHKGVDFKVPAGTALFSVSDATVEKTQFSQTYGNIVFLRHSDGTATLYAHLSKSEVTVGQKIKKGQEIAKSGNTGSRTTGAHLHFEYYPNGHNYADGSQQDPFACITDGNVDGSITVRDNGNIADDSFELYLDGYLLGTTSIGGINSFAANNLRPGHKVLTLKCVVAPDNVGTFEVVLNNGILFEAGGTEDSGELEEGQSVSWNIIIPKQATNAINTGHMKPNAAVERRIQ